MNSILRRRRGLMRKKDEAGPVYLYRNGETLPELGSLSLLGFNSNTGYNKIEYSGTSIHYWNTSTSSVASIKGARTLTFQNQLSANYAGKKMYSKLRHKNTSTNTIEDYAGVYISDAVTDSTNLTDAFTGRSGALKKITTTDNSYTEYINSYTISKGGYVSIIVRKNGAGETNWYIDEVWIE